MHGSAQDVSIASQPSGASVSVDNQTLGTTPVVAKLKRKDKHTIVVKMDGYQPFEVVTTRSTSGWVWGNIVFGGLIGLAVDLGTGGAYKINPAQVNADLARAHADATFQDGTLYVVLVRIPDASWQKIGQLQPLR
ncbi:MAG: PEGA domain-containing protein [Gemmatimonadetes bacterium]|nr:MAG: PEGA domain-containing protein [Gemmatimonadota bacterium]